VSAFERIRRPSNMVSRSGLIKSIDRAITVLDMLAEAGPNGAPLRVLSKRMDVNPSTLHHLLATLKQRRVVEQDSLTKPRGSRTTGENTARAYGVSQRLCRMRRKRSWNASIWCSLHWGARLRTSLDWQRSCATVLGGFRRSSRRSAWWRVDRRCDIRVTLLRVVVSL
jgi:hypothetical protein